MIFWQVLTALSKRCQKLSNRFWQPCQKAVKPGFDSFWQRCEKLSKLAELCQKLSKPVLTEEVLTGGRARNPSTARCQKADKSFDKGLTGLWQSFDRGSQRLAYGVFWLVGYSAPSRLGAGAIINRPTRGSAWYVAVRDVWFRLGAGVARSRRRAPSAPAIINRPTRGSA